MYRLNQINHDGGKSNDTLNLQSKQNFKTPFVEANHQIGNETNKTSTTNNIIKEIPKNVSNNLNDKVEKEKEPANYNLSLSRYIELKSHFDVVRKLGYLPNINALVSISEVLL